MLGSCLEADVLYRGQTAAKLIVLEEEMPFESSDDKILEYMRVFLQRHFNIIYEERQEDLYDMHRIVSSMLKSDGGVLSPVAEHMLEMRGWNKDDHYEIVVMQHQTNAQTDLTSGYICAQLEQLYRESCAVRVGDHIVCLLNYRKNTEKSSYQELAYYLREGMYRAGISQRFDSFFKLRHYYRQAWIALRHNQSSSIWYTHFDDCALQYMVLKCTGEFTGMEVCHPGLLKLRDYDKEMGTEYCKTLYAYMDTMYNARAASERLFIHRTTFFARLRRIEEVAGIHLESMDTRLHLMLSFRLEKLI